MSRNEKSVSSASIGESLRQAVSLHMSGNHEEAAKRYLEILNMAPAHADALHFLGVLRYQQGEVALGERLIRQALSISPDNPTYLGNYGPVLRALGRESEAEACYLRALVLKPASPEVWLNYGNLLASTKRFEEAESYFRRVAAATPENLTAWNNLAGVLRETARYAEARQLLSPLIDRYPRFPKLRITLGNVALDDGCPAEAEQVFREAHATFPGDVEVLIGLGVLLLRLKRPAEAEPFLRSALAASPDNSVAMSNLGNILSERGERDEAEKLYRKSLALDASYADAHSNLGHLLRKQGRLAEAEQATREALRLKPKSVEALVNLGAIRWESGYPDEALQQFEQALALRPNFADAWKNAGIIRLLLGDFARGWQYFEHRFETDEFARTFPAGCAARWRGEELSNKRILVIAEQGFGDVIQFLRFGHALRDRGAHVLFAVKKGIVELVQASSCCDEVLAINDPLPPHDFVVAMMSLPHCLGETNFFADQIPYLKASPTLTSQWRERLASYPGLKVGIAWQGRKTYAYDRYRSIPLRYFAPLAQVPGVTLFSLQKNFGREQIEPLRSQIPLVDLGEALDETTGAFVETAAVMMNLDLIVSSDTALVHLAGALGQTVWVPIGPVPDWRWGLQGDATPWYPTMRLFREAQRGDWTDSIARIANTLEARVSTAGVGLGRSWCTSKKYR